FSRDWRSDVCSSDLLDIAGLIGASTPDTHFYCCGPNGMLEAFENATADCRDRAHVEYFTPKAEAALGGGFEVELAQSGRVLQVQIGRASCREKEQRR